jgi:hypothetical protein
MNMFCKCLIACIIGLLLGALLLCFEETAFLLPFTITWMTIAAIGAIVCAVCWAFDGWK